MGHDSDGASPRGTDEGRAPDPDEGPEVEAGAGGQARVPARWIWLAVLVGVAAAAIGWGLRAQGVAAAREAALRDAHEALDRGTTAAAGEALRRFLDADGDAAAPEFAWATGRVKAAQRDLPAARAAFAQAAAGAASWPLEQQLSLALHRIDAEVGAGEHAAAQQLCDDALSAGASVLDAHLDRDDLGPNALPTGASPPTVEPALPLELELLVRRVRAGTGHAEALAARGDHTAATEVLEATEAAVANRICTGTHRLVCRGIRGQLRDRVLAPLRSARVRVSVAAVLELARAGQIDEANDRLAEAIEALTVASRGPPPTVEDRDALRMGTDVGYALQVVGAERAEAEHDFATAARRWSAAAEAWAKLRTFDVAPAPVGKGGEAPAIAVPGAAGLPATATPTVPIHELGLRRAQAIQAAIDATRSNVDVLAAVGVGDAERRDLHAAIAAHPRDAKVYLDGAVRWIQRSRRPDRDAEQAKADLALARQLVGVARVVRPDAVAARFWAGVVDLLDGHPVRGVAAMTEAWAAGGLSSVEARLLAESLERLGQQQKAAAMFEQVWRLQPDDVASARRAIAMLLELGRAEDAAKLLRDVRAAGGDVVGVAEAEAAVALVQGQPQRWASARLALDGASGYTPGDAMVRGQRIATAMSARSRTALAATLRPGEVVLETVFGQAVSAASADAVGTKRLQCAVLVFTDQRLILLRWDAERDLGAAVRKGATLLRQGLVLGADLGLESLGLDLGTWGPVIETVRKIAGVPSADAGAAKAPHDPIHDTGELIVATLALLDTVQQDLALQGAEPRIHVVDPGAVLAWRVRAVQGERDLWQLRVRARDGASAFATDGDALVLHHDRPMLLRLLLRARLGAPAIGP